MLPWTFWLKGEALCCAFKGGAAFLGSSASSLAFFIVRRNLDHAETPLVAHAGSGQVPDYGPQKGPRQDDHPIARREEEGDGAPQDPRQGDHREEKGEEKGCRGFGAV